MIKKVLLLLLVINTIGVQPIKAQTNNSLLWEISGNGLKKSSYLYGTFHVRDKRVFQFDKVVLKKLKSCEVVTGELDMDMGAMMLTLFKNINKMFLPSGTKLKDLYDNDEDYEIVKNYIKDKLGIMSGMADSLQPIITSSMLEEGEAGFGNDYKYVLDDYFQKLGKMKGKEVKGLETIDEQLNALSNISQNEQAEMLLATCTKKEDDEQFSSIDMIELYCNQNITALDSLINGTGGAQFSEELLFKRNQTMATRIDELIKTKTCFNTFGAAHLGGKLGIINLLSEMGYQVTPIIFTFNEKNKPIELKSK